MPILWIALALTAFTLAVSLVFYLGAFYSKNDTDVSSRVLTGPEYDPFRREMIALIDEAIAHPRKDVYVTSYDGIKLYGRVYLQKEGAPFHIQFNGYKGNGIRDFSGGLKLALERGDNVLLADQRAHGHSGGHTITFGVKERKDVLTWIEYINDTYGKETPIYLEGISMGAATVLMASGMDLPRNVRGVIADCPYSSPGAIVERVARSYLKVPYISFPFITVGALVFGRFFIYASTPARAVKKARVPILLIHGTADRFVPIEMSERIYEANKEAVTFLKIKDAPHGLCFLKDREGYQNAYRAFLERTLS